MIIPFNDIMGGVISDTPDHQLPPNAWSAGENVRFINGVAEKSKGESLVYDPPTIAPYWLLPVPQVSAYYWVYAGLAKVYTNDSATDYNITREKATSITAASIANPTVITAAAHGITDQDTVVITGDTTATPTINGTHTATVLSTDTFTVPVNVTVAGTDGTVTGDTNYSATASHNWNGGSIQGIPVFNNGFDDPQMWNPVDSVQRLTSLTWDSGDTWAAKGYTVKCMRAFDHVLFGLDFNNGSIRYPRRVMWSHPADPGDVPPTWDETDTTKDAGFIDLDETSGFCIDGVALGNTFIVYKEDGYYGFQSIATNSIFRNWLIDSNTGILSRRCAKEFEGKHIVLCIGPDVKVHSGGRAISILNRRWRKWLTANLDADNYERAYIAPNYNTKEMWICIPTSGDDFPSIALVWNWEEDTFGVRNLTGAAHIGFGVVDPSEDDTWDADTDIWDSDISVWDARLYNPSRQSFLIADATNTKLYLADDTNTFNGTNMTSYLERTGLHSFQVGNQTIGGEDIIKKVRKLRPRIASTGPIIVKVGFQMKTSDAITWKTYSFDPVTQDEVDVRVSGKYIGIHFGSTTDIHWELHGYDLDLKLGGTR
jgi:hypothetical protein